MRVQWVQVTMEVVEESAPDLAVLLETTEAEAGWGLIKLIKWFLGRVPEGQYPSRHDLVPGPNAARLIARAAGYMGSPQRYVEALQELAKPILQVMTDGVRMRGMDRYDVMLDEAEARHAKAKKAADARWGSKPSVEHAPSISQASPEHHPSNAPRCLERDSDLDLDSDSKEPPPPPPKLVVVGSGRKELTVADLTPGQRARWDIIQRGRENFGQLRETAPPAAFPTFCDRPKVAELDPERFEHAVALYLSDPDFKAKLWPTAVLITPGVWRPRVPLPPREVAH